MRLLKKTNINTCDEKGASLLMWMSYNGNQPMCEILLRQGALVDKPDHEGNTALFIAAFCGHTEICTLLLENKASVIKQMKVQLHFQSQPKTVMLMHVHSYLKATHMSINKIVKENLHCL